MTHQAAEDYHCFGLPVLAPAAGTVVAARDGLRDNTPGRMAWWRPLGNHVVIDHGGGEFSFLAHLRDGTVRVRPGDRVATGQPLGACGNSGNSSEPHLHYHMQTTPRFGRGDGLPAQVQRYRVGDRVVARGEPARGERVENCREQRAGGSEQ